MDLMEVSCPPHDVFFTPKNQLVGGVLTLFFFARFFPVTTSELEIPPAFFGQVLASTKEKSPQKSLEHQVDQDPGLGVSPFKALNALHVAWQKIIKIQFKKRVEMSQNQGLPSPQTQNKNRVNHGNLRGWAP